MGADSRSSAGSIQVVCSLRVGIYVANRVANKIEQIDDTICMCRSGSAAHTQKIGNIVRAQLNQYRWGASLFS